MNFSIFPKNLGFLVHPKSEGKSLGLEKKILFVTCSLYWGDPCVHVSFNLELKNQTWEEKCRFWEKIVFSRDLLLDNIQPHRTMFYVTWTRSNLQFWVPETPSQIMFDWDFHLDVYTRFWPYLANRVSNWSHYFFHCVSNFEGIISTMLVGVFITFLQCFGFRDWTWDIGWFLQKNLISVIPRSEK
jgi:hypothetical protein